MPTAQAIGSVILLFAVLLKKVSSKYLPEHYALFLFLTWTTFSLSLAPCLIDANCKQTEICHRSLCKNPCNLPDACGINADCSIQGHRKTCSCPPLFTGNADVECVRVPSTCASSSDCPRGMSCNEGICQWQCGSDSECADNERCHKPGQRTELGAGGCTIRRANKRRGLGANGSESLRHLGANEDNSGEKSGKWLHLLASTVLGDSAAVVRNVAM